MSIDERLIASTTPDVDAPAVVVRVAGTSGVGALVDQGAPNAGGAQAWPVDVQATVGLTDAELRAVPVPVSGTQTDALTDVQLRATPVPVSGPLTDAELRAAAVPISAASLPLPTGAATAANQQTDALTNTQLRAAPVVMSGAVITI